MSAIDDLAATIRAGLDADERIARTATPGPWIQKLATDKTWIIDRQGSESREPYIAGGGGCEAPGCSGGGIESGCDAKHICRHDPERTLADIAAKRALLDLLLAEKHHVAEDPWYTCTAATNERDGGSYAAENKPRACNCGRDARVTAYLALLAEPYQEGLE